MEHSLISNITHICLNLYLLSGHFFLYLVKFCCTLESYTHDRKVHDLHQLIKSRAIKHPHQCQSYPIYNLHTFHLHYKGD